MNSLMSVIYMKLVFRAKRKGSGTFVYSTETLTIA